MLQCTTRAPTLTGFKKGLNPERRSTEYLEKGSIFLRKQVSVLTLSVPPPARVDKNSWRTTDEAKALAEVQRPGGRFKDTSEAASFLYWHWGQLQYQNPHVQLVAHHFKFPTAFFRAFLRDGSDILIDLEGHSRADIHARLKRVLGKTEAALRAEELEETKRQNPATFGSDAARHCACEIPGAFPCPSLLPCPKYMRAGWRYNQNLPS